MLIISPPKVRLRYFFVHRIHSEWVASFMSFFWVRFVGDTKHPNYPGFEAWVGLGTSLSCYTLKKNPIQNLSFTGIEPRFSWYDDRTYPQSLLILADPLKSKTGIADLIFLYGDVHPKVSDSTHTFRTITQSTLTQ